MFERDKVELRELGVPIESIGEEGSDESAYRLRAKEFYLPYLGIVSARGIEQPTKVDRFGYHSLETLAFGPDELQAIVEAARLVSQVGDPVLADDARSAIRKLAFDLPLGAIDGTPDATLVAPTSRAARSRRAERAHGVMRAPVRKLLPRRSPVSSPAPSSRTRPPCSTHVPRLAARR